MLEIRCLKAFYMTFSQFFRFKGRITFIIIAVIDTFHINFPTVNIIRQGIFQQIFDFNIFNRAAFHCEQVVFSMLLNVCWEFRSVYEWKNLDIECTLCFKINTEVIG